MEIKFTGTVWYWRGPAPFYFVSLPEDRTREIKQIERLVTYGWGMIPVTALVGSTKWSTALTPKDGCYILPLKDKVRKAENIIEGDCVSAELTIENID